MTARQRMLSQKARHTPTAFLFLLPFLTVFAISIVIPLFYALWISFFRKQMVGGTVFVGFGNYVRAFGDTLLHDGVLRVLLFLALQVPIMLAIAMFAALAIDSGRLGGSRIVRIGLFLPYAVPSVVAALMWGYIFGGQFGLASQVFGALGLPTPDFLGAGLMLASVGNVVTWSFVGYNMLIFYAALRSISTDVYEAASIDGAGEIRKAWSIKLPALRPALTLAVIFSIIGSLQLFNEPSILQALRPSVVTTSWTPNLYAYNLAFSGAQTNYAAAVAMLLGGITVAIAYVVQLGIGQAGAADMTALAIGRRTLSAQGRATRRCSPSSCGRILAYFMLPLAWLLVNSTKTNADLFGTFGLAFADKFALWDNIGQLLSFQDGIYLRWFANTILYAGVGASGAALIAAMGGYGLAKFDFYGRRTVLIFGARRYRRARHGARCPDLHAVQPMGPRQHRAGGDHPRARQPLRALPDDGLRHGCGARRHGRGRPHRRRQRGPHLLDHRPAADDAGLRDCTAVPVGRDLEQLLPAADRPQSVRQVPAHRRAQPLEQAGQRRRRQPRAAALSARHHRLAARSGPAHRRLRLPPALLAIRHRSRRNQGMTGRPTGSATPRSNEPGAPKRTTKKGEKNHDSTQSPNDPRRARARGIVRDWRPSPSHRTRWRSRSGPGCPTSRRPSTSSRRPIPNIKVKVENVGVGTDEYLKITNAVDAGSGGPDVAHMTYDAIPNFVITGALADVTQFGAPNIRDVFLPGVLGLTEFNGGVYGIPQDFGPGVMYYRKDVFDDAGVAVPATWAEFADAAEKIHANNPERYISFLAPGLVDAAYMGLWQLGAEPWHVTDGTNVSVNLQSEKALQWANYWDDLNKKGLLVHSEMGSDEWFKQLGAGQVAAWVVGAWGLQALTGVLPRQQGSLARRAAARLERRRQGHQPVRRIGQRRPRAERQQGSGRRVRACGSTPAKLKASTRSRTTRACCPPPMRRGRTRPSSTRRSNISAARRRARSSPSPRTTLSSAGNGFRSSPM